MKRVFPGGIPDLSCATAATRLVRRFAAALGWRGVERMDVLLTPDIAGRLPAGTIATGWSNTDRWFFIQINQCQAGRFGSYAVTVVAERYAIAPLDFEACSFRTAEEADAEARRLAPRLARANFRDRRWRREFLERHPERLLRPWKKWRGWKARLREAFSR